MCHIFYWSNTFMIWNDNIADMVKEVKTSGLTGLKIINKLRIIKIVMNAKDLGVFWVGVFTVFKGVGVCKGWSLVEWGEENELEY